MDLMFWVCVAFLVIVIVNAILRRFYSVFLLFVAFSLFLFLVGNPYLTMIAGILLTTIALIDLANIIKIIRSQAYKQLPKASQLKFFKKKANEEEILYKMLHRIRNNII
ncbi:MAG: hypothetical protein KKD89_05770 [Candidatus Omnitrophica bacterium]|nr:hypothetical protein [Candidatus Omnitrophota bacterium]MBU1889557.1 hypothetical protein [Candidatus Omnitrophota bacterium]